MRKQEDTKKNETKGNRKKLLTGIIIGVSIGCITLGALFAIFMILVFYGGPAETVTDVSGYKETLTQYENLHTAFICFPEELPESAENTDFYFYYRDAWDDPTMEVYLQCSYDEKDYQAEVERLENTRKQYGSTVRTLIRDREGRYPYPAYIAVDGLWNAYEYALLSGERQITYVYTAYKNSNNLKKVDKKYLPVDFDERQEELKRGDGYCIYLKQVDKMDGEVIGWDYDYTRNEVVDVLEYHPLEVGYNFFGVCTALDENDNRIIQYCYDWKYKNSQDSVYGLPDETRYREQEGYGFKSVELSADETKAIVTYFDKDGEERTMEYETPTK